MKTYENLTEIYGLTDTELDKIALSAGELPGRAALEHGNPYGDIGVDYTVITINTRGTNNLGNNILIGRTPRGKRLVWEGKVYHLRSKGCSESVAKAAVSTKYGMEESVWKLALEIFQMVKMGATLRPISHQHFTVLTGISREEHLCSFTRVLAAISIAEKASRK